MAIGSGLSAQHGIKTETTFGTAVTVDRFYPLVSSSLTEDIARLESEGILTGRRLITSEQWAAGNVAISGQVGMELYQQNMALWFKHALGAVSTTGSDPYTHTCTPGDLSDDFFTYQVGVPGVGGTVRPFTFAGCMISEWELAVSAGELPTFGVSVVAQSMATGTALASASYGTGDAKPFTFAHAGVSIASSAASVKELSLSCNNGLDVERYFLGSSQISKPIEAERREVTGEMTLEFDDLTQLNRYRNGTEAALEITFNAGSSAQCNITANVRYDGSTPGVEGRGIVTLSAPFKVIAASTDAAAFEVEVINGDSAA